MLYVPLLVILKTMPYTFPQASVCGPVEVSIITLNQRPVRISPVCQIEGVQNRQGARRRHLVHRAVARCAAKNRGSVEVSVRCLNRRSVCRIAFARQRCGERSTHPQA